jgi:hypothetical protein
MTFDLEGYTTVQERLKEFYFNFPSGSIQFEFMGILPGAPLMMWGIARAYRTPEDTRPGIGTAAELIEGKTPYTRGSELQNLETSAWGRACASLNIGLSKGIASKQEVQAAKERQAPGPKITPPMETDPWALEAPPIEDIGGAPQCQHGAMTRKIGTSKTTGKPFAGWVCGSGGVGEQCAAKWDRS